MKGPWIPQQGMLAQRAKRASVDQYWHNVCLRRLCGPGAFKSLRGEPDFGGPEGAYFVLPMLPLYVIQEKRYIKYNEGLNADTRL